MADDSPPFKNLRSRPPIHGKTTPHHHGSLSSLNDTTDKSELVETESESEEIDESDESKGDINNSALSGKSTPKKRGGKIKDKKSPSPTPVTRRAKQEKNVPRSERKSKEENEEDENTSLLSGIRIIGMFIIIIVGFALYFGFALSDSDPVNVVNSQTLVEKFNQDMNVIKSKFPSQSPKFWKIMKISVRKILLEANPDYPAVLLLVAPSGSKSSKIGTCIAKHLTKTINSLFNVTSERIINIKDIGNIGPDAEKKELDRKIKNSFENEHLRSVAVDHFEELAPRASLLFHGYCDGDNAPFKNVAIVFILHTDLEKESLKTDPTLIDKHLINLWSSTDSPLDRDKIDPLIARVANNPAIIEEEENFKDCGL